MNGHALLAFFIFAFFGIIVAIFFILMMISAAINKSKLLAEMACKLVLVYIAAIVIFFVVETVWLILFDLMTPQLSVNGDQMTILNSGNGSMGSMSIYICSEEDILEEIDTPQHWHRMTGSRKFGYTFASRAAGDLYVVVAEIDCADLSYADIYDVKVDQDGSIAAEKVEHINIGQNMYRNNVEELMERLVSEYGFSREVLEETYGYYLYR